MLQSLRSSRRPIFALALVGAVALGLLLGLPTATRATTRTGHDFTYYNNAAHDTAVGYRYYCVGYSGGWGQITAYSESNDFPCR